MSEPTKLYELTDEIRELLETALNIVAQTSTVQYNEEARLGLLGLAETIAQHFDVEVTYVEDDELEDFEHDGGTVH